MIKEDIKGLKKELEEKQKELDKELSHHFTLMWKHAEWGMRLIIIWGCLSTIYVTWKVFFYIGQYLSAKLFG